MPPTPTTDRFQVVDDLEQRLRTDGDALSVLETSARALLAAVPADAWCGVTVDPSTLLDTAGVHLHDFPAHLLPRMFEIEHVEQDGVDSLRSLARRTTPVSLLSRSTYGELETSKHYREILRPLGLADELRILLREAGRTWGMLSLCRASGTAPFTGDELALAEAVSAPTTSALRRGLLLHGADTPQVADAPGLLVLDREQRIRSASTTARRWLGELPQRSPSQRCPYAVRALAATVSRTRAGSGAGAGRARVQTRAGVWVTLHAWQLERAGESLTAVSLGPAEPTELVALVLEAYRLTARERDVAQQVLLGRSTTEIAGRLLVSADTVGDHLNSVFDKVGVHSRGELVTRLYLAHYARQPSHALLTTDGRRLPTPPQPADLGTRDLGTRDLGTRDLGTRDLGETRPEMPDPDPGFP